MKKQYYKTIDKCPVGNYIDASTDIRYLLILDDYNKLPKINEELTGELSGIYAELTSNTFTGVSDLVLTMEEFSVMQAGLYYRKTLFTSYYSPASPAKGTDEVLKLMKKWKFTGDFNKDVIRYKNYNRKLQVTLKELNAVHKNRQEKSDNNYIEDFNDSLLSISKWLGYHVDRNKFTLLDYKNAVKKMEAEYEFHKKANNRTGKV